MSKISLIKKDKFILNIIIIVLLIYGIIYLYDLMSVLLFVKFDTWNLLNISIKLASLVVIPLSYFICCKLKKEKLLNNIFLCGCVINLTLLLIGFNSNINSCITVLRHICYLFIVLLSLNKTLFQNFKYFNLIIIITFIFLFVEFMFKLESIIVYFDKSIVNLVLCSLYFIYLCLSILFFKSRRM